MIYIYFRIITQSWRIRSKRSRYKGLSHIPTFAWLFDEEWARRCKNGINPHLDWEEVVYIEPPPPAFYGWQKNNGTVIHHFLYTLSAIFFAPSPEICPRVISDQVTWTGQVTQSPKKLLSYSSYSFGAINMKLSRYRKAISDYKTHTSNYKT